MQQLKREVKVLKFDEWLTTGKMLFGEDTSKWRFKCPKCGNIQSVESIKKHNPGLEFGFAKVYFCCEGIFNKKYGCKWKASGSVEIHTVEIIDAKDNIHQVFEFAI